MAERLSIDLAPLCTDDWFEQLLREMPELDELCVVLGWRCVAMSFVGGVRIVGVECDQRVPSASKVRFALADGDGDQVLELAVFQRQLASAIVADIEQPRPVPIAQTADEARKALGRRLLLVSPIFGVALETLQYGDDGPPTVAVETSEGKAELSVPALQSKLKECILAEFERPHSSTPAVSIDFNLVPQAVAANARGQYATTVLLLGPWADPLSQFLRTAQGQALARRERDLLAGALGVLGEAYAHTNEFDWAEDVLRLGIQWGADSAATAHLYQVLGLVQIRRDRCGQAIGLLRRALALGASEASVLPLLAESFLARRRFVAALACADQAVLAGAPSTLLAHTRAEAIAALGPAYDALTAFLTSAEQDTEALAGS